MSENMKDDMTKEIELAMIEEGAVGSIQSMAIRLLRDKGISRADLAKEMGVTASYVSQLLGDEPKNLSIKKAAVLFHHLGEELRFTCSRIEEMDRTAEKRNLEKKQTHQARQSMMKSMKTWSECANDDYNNGRFLAAV